MSASQQDGNGSNGKQETPVTHARQSCQNRANPLDTMVAAVTGQIAGMPTDPRYIATLAIAEPVACSQVVDALLSQADRGDDDVEALILLGQAAHAIGDPVRTVRFLDRAEARLRQRGNDAWLLPGPHRPARRARSSSTRRPSG
jgi:hypothetical protein